MYKKISKQFDYKFSIKQFGLYAIFISASCKSGKILGLFGGEDLRVEVDGRKLREIPAKDKPQYKDIPSTWNGTKLNGLTKTVIFILWLEQGEHIIKFIPHLSASFVFKRNAKRNFFTFFSQKGAGFIPYKGAVIEKEPQVARIEDTNNIEFNLEEQAQDSNRRPWITLALIDLPLSILDVSVRCEKRKRDSDDVKLIIDGQIQKNKQSKWWSRNWYWQGRQLQGNIEETRFYPKLSRGVHYIEFWADRKPTLHKVELDLGEIEDKKSENYGDGEMIYNDPEKIAEDFNRAYVLKDSVFNNKDAMSENDIQEFLDKYHQVKDKPHISKIEFNGHGVAYWIKKAAIKYLINPRLLLTKLQAEQRLIKGSKAIDPNEYQFHWAMGAGRLDDGTVIEELKGFVIQITYAAKYFRKFYQNAEAVDFTHPDVDGKKLKVVNAATYSLYKYTPHVAGPKLVYDVYKMFFGVDDLGGGILLKEKNSGKINLKILFISILSIILILIAGIVYVYNKNKPIYSWQNKIAIGNNLELIADLKIFKEKEATIEDDLYCGYRFYKIYKSNAKLLLSHNNKIMDSIDLTNPELVMPDLSDEHLTYYKPWDIDGDGKKQEFIIQEYGACNGNLFSFVRVNKELKRIEKIPVAHQNKNENFILYVDIGKDAFKVSNGVIKVKYYDNTNTDTSLHGFVQDYYEYDIADNKLAWFIPYE